MTKRGENENARRRGGGRGRRRAARGAGSFECCVRGAESSGSGTRSVGRRRSRSCGTRRGVPLSPSAFRPDQEMVSQNRFQTPNFPPRRIGQGARPAQGIRLRGQRGVGCTPTGLPVKQQPGHRPQHARDEQADTKPTMNPPWTCARGHDSTRPMHLGEISRRFLESDGLNVNAVG